MCLVQCLFHFVVVVSGFTREKKEPAILPFTVSSRWHLGKTLVANALVSSDAPDACNAPDTSHLSIKTELTVYKISRVLCDSPHPSRRQNLEKRKINFWRIFFSTVGYCVTQDDDIFFKAKCLHKQPCLPHGAKVMSCALQSSVCQKKF